MSIIEKLKSKMTPEVKAAFEAEVAAIKTTPKEKGEIKVSGKPTSRYFRENIENHNEQSNHHLKQMTHHAQQMKADLARRDFHSAMRGFHEDEAQHHKEMGERLERYKSLYGKK